MLISFPPIKKNNGTFEYKESSITVDEKLNVISTFLKTLSIFSQLNSKLGIYFF